MEIKIQLAKMVKEALWLNHELLFVQFFDVVLLILLRRMSFLSQN